MTPELIAAAAQLAETLARENAALAKLDFGQATSLLPYKTRETDAFVAAQALESRQGPPGMRAKAEVEALAARLSSLAQENKRLLEHAIGVQGRVIGTIARAVPRARANNAPRYSARGALPEARRPNPVAISTRA